MLTQRNNSTRVLTALALLVVFASAGAILNAKGKPTPPPPTPTISFSMTMIDGSYAEAMNELGDVVGTMHIAGLPRPFLYYNDTGETINLYDLFTPADQDQWISWWAYGINCQRQISGSAYKLNQETGEVENFAVLFTPEHTDELENVVPASVITIGPPGDASYGFDINESGVVTGSYSDNGNVARGFVYSDGVFEDIGDLGGGRTAAYAINNSGEVAGISYDTDGNGRAFRYDPQTQLMENLGIIKAGMPSLFGNHSSGFDINDFSVVVGNASAGARKGHNKYHVFRDAGAGMEDLGTLGGLQSGTSGVNSMGEIVGQSYDNDNQNVNFLYTDEIGMVALQPLIINLPADMKTMYVHGINDLGEIFGDVTFTDGTGSVFLLTPN